MLSTDALLLMFMCEVTTTPLAPQDRAVVRSESAGVRAPRTRHLHPLLVSRTENASRPMVCRSFGPHARMIGGRGLLARLPGCPPSHERSYCEVRGSAV